MKIEHSKKDTLIIIGLIAVFSLGFRLLSHYEFHTSALLYIGFPLLISVTLVLFTGKGASQNWKIRYWNHTRSALIVMLASSILLFEGFLCVLMFMPIYFGIMLCVFFIEFIYRSVSDKPGGKVSVHVLPAILAVSSLEGVTPQLSFDRYNEVSSSKTINLSISQIKENLQQPIMLGDDMPTFLSLFPMPYDVEAETLSQGDVHRSYFRYHRWFITNTHEGYIDIQLQEVASNHIRTKVLDDTSYFSNYLTLHGTVIELHPITEDKTRVTLTVSYDRKLDPAWYFHPLERFAVEQTAGYLIEQIIDRQGGVNDG